MQDAYERLGPFVAENFALKPRINKCENIISTQACAHSVVEILIRQNPHGCRSSTWIWANAINRSIFIARKGREPLPNIFDALPNFVILDNGV